ncbi:MAG: sodium:calcium symporter [Armatimonadetes bacterium]|nr:sodium:calcium symporter [Armatimonadota bacterium]MDW8121775.1 sodium:calcium symporter [Armatimonadota bacterium]
MGQKEGMERVQERERWASKIGLILAMAGNAVGLGNFLRFPVRAARFGGGAFMVPYFICFLLMGIPLMWVEWAIGRFGGRFGHGSTPGMFDKMWRHPIAKYIGVLGLFAPTVIMIYYTYIESWTLAYSVRAFLGRLPHPPPPDLLGGDVQQYLKPFSDFFGGYVGPSAADAYFDFVKAGGNWVWPVPVAIFLFCMILNVWVLARGVAKGIELLAKVAMPLLFLFALLLVGRVFTLGNPVVPGQGPLQGLAYVWEPQFFVDKCPECGNILVPGQKGLECSKEPEKHVITDHQRSFVLTDGTTWLEAAGQIFFTLSLGMGAIPTYASYVGPDEDIVVTGLATSSANELAEVVLGGSIAIPAATAFFGLNLTKRIAATFGTFGLGFIVLPALFRLMPFGDYLAGIWFLLLFFAAFTSSVAMAQPAMAFLQDELGWRREKAAVVLGAFFFLAAQQVIFFPKFLDELDFWGGSFTPVVFSMLELFIFLWIFGSDRAWEEIHRGAALRVPRIFHDVGKYFTTFFLAIILIVWFKERLPGLMVAEPTVWMARGFMAALMLLMLGAIHYAFTIRRRNQ